MAAVQNTLPENPFFTSSGDQAGMVYVRMGEQEGVYPRGIEGKVPLAVFILGVAALAHAAIDQDAPILGLNQMAGAR